ncbi:MAG: 5-methylthioadenosine/S-adenosylhomocysteine deaminase [Thermoanaerobacteraceae bacterium]|nr:5-methylthioadenosine/S-adenosylhomocysteine deaminase [Thermoanaerobacteraceae bacterium]
MNILIKNATLLSMGDKEEPVENVEVAIEKDKIKYIGEVPEDFYAEKVIDARESLVMPGLIDGHTHIAMSLFRNYADDLPLMEWLKTRIWLLEEKLTAQDVYWGSMLGVAELIRSGVTCFSDMYFFMEETAKAVEEAGIRAVLARGLVGGDNDDGRRFEETRKLYKSWHNGAGGRIKVMVGPHAPYTCSPGYLRKVVELARELNVGIHIHIAESADEVEESLKNYGKSPVRHIYDLGLFDIPTVAAHCVHLSDEDIEILAENKVSVVNNPTSNLKLASGFAPVEKMIKKGINVALGTDGPSSNNNLNMFEEMNLAAIINKSVNHDATSIPAITAIKMATVNGAKALGLEKEIASIEVGKKADLIIIDTQKPHFYPRHNIISALAYSAQASDVKTVIVDGKIVMEDYEIKTIDTERIMFEAEKAAKDLMRR